LSPKKRPVICPRAREQGFASVLEFFADATHSAMCSKSILPISLFKSSTGVEVAHHVDNVLPSVFWNKSWLEQNLEQGKPCRIKELHSSVPVFQRSDQKSMVWESENKKGQVVSLILRVQNKNRFTPLLP
jgi:hypothetical protein